MKKQLCLLAIAALVFGAPACQQSYTEKAENADSGHRDEDIEDTDKSVHDQADGGMGTNENQTEGNGSGK